jgi:hypothetical protein
MYSNGIMDRMKLLGTFRDCANAPEIHTLVTRFILYVTFSTDNLSVDMIVTVFYSFLELFGWRIFVVVVFLRTSVCGRYNMCTFGEARCSESFENRRNIIDSYGMWKLPVYKIFKEVSGSGFLHLHNVCFI